MEIALTGILTILLTGITILFRQPNHATRLPYKGRPIEWDRPEQA